MSNTSSEYDFPDISPDLLQSIPKSFASKVKLTKEDQEELQALLGVAIEQQSPKLVQDAIDQGAQVKTSSKINGVRVISHALKHFDQGVIDVLSSQKGFRLGYFDSLVRESAEAGNIEAVKWLFKDSQTGMSAHRAAFDGAMKSGNPDMLEEVLRFNRTHDSKFSFMVNRAHNEPRNWMQELPVWYSYNMLNMVVTHRHEGLLNEILSLQGMDRPPQNKNTYHPTTFLFYGLSNLFRRSDYSSSQWWQQQLTTNENLKKVWKKNLPFQMNGRLHQVTVTTFMQLLIAQGAKTIESVALTEKGRKVLFKNFQDPNLLETFIGRAPRPTSSLVFNLMKEEFATWTDTDGNNLGHYLLKDSPNKSVATEIYSQNKDWLSQENKHGKTPLDHLPEKARATVSNKLLRGTLHQAKVGLVHNRKKTARRM